MAGSIPKMSSPTTSEVTAWTAFGLAVVLLLAFVWYLVKKPVRWCCWCFGFFVAVLLVAIVVLTAVSVSDLEQGYEAVSGVMSFMPNVL